MGRAPCCDRANVKRGPWSPEEDTTLKNYLHKHGTGGNWIALPHKAGLSISLPSFMSLPPALSLYIKHGGFTQEEDSIIWTLYNNIGSKWSLIASHLPGRTDNDVKNYWNTKLKKKLVPNITSKSNAGKNRNGSSNQIHHMGYNSYSHSNHPVNYGSSSATQVATTTMDPLQRLSGPSSHSMDDESCMPMPWAWAAAADGGGGGVGEFGRLFDDFGHGSSSDFQEMTQSYAALVQKVRQKDKNGDFRSISGVVFSYYVFCGVDWFGFRIDFTTKEMAVISKAAVFIIPTSRDREWVQMA
ncbi:hypothetical protein ACLOJK_019883 [Asimina triloba]